MVNAAGMKVPPMIIHKGNTVTAAWLTNCPDDVLVRAQESGYINTDLFLEMGYHFLEFLKKNQLDTLRHLILLDGHVTHTYNSYFINLMKANNVLVVLFPPHCSAFLQPLDATPFATLKNTWQRELHYWNRKKCGRAITKSEWFLLFRRAWRSVSVPTIVKGFRETGIFPLDFSVIPEDVFAPSDIMCPPTAAANVTVHQQRNGDGENLPAPRNSNLSQFPINAQHF